MLVAALVAAQSVSGCDRMRGARVLKAQKDLRMIYDAALEYEHEHGRLPTSIEEMAVPPDLGGFSCLYALAPWRNPYRYEFTDSGPVITCFGADGKPGGLHEDADLFYSARGSRP